MLLLCSLVSNLSPAPMTEEIISSIESMSPVDEFRLLASCDPPEPSDFAQKLLQFPSGTSYYCFHKNRYSNVLPNEHTRVRLSQTGELGSDYINANHVKVPVGDTFESYIACQAPLPATFYDFWRMVWEQNSYVIVMLTKLVEKCRVKAHVYWPEENLETKRYGDISIQLCETKYENEKDSTDTIITRSFKIERAGETRKIVHLHYTGWPDFGVPKSTVAIRQLSKLVEEYKGRLAAGFESPIVVHCSAGVGRAGSFISIHATMKCHQFGFHSNVMQVVSILRQHRSGMVQTEDQYEFIHNTIRDFKEELRSKHVLLPQQTALPINVSDGFLNTPPIFSCNSPTPVNLNRISAHVASASCFYDPPTHQRSGCDLSRGELRREINSADIEVS